MAFTINIITQSSDHYLIVLDNDPKLEEIIDTIKDKLGNEINYISSWNFTATYKITETFKKVLNKKLNSFGE